MKKYFILLLLINLFYTLSFAQGEFVVEINNTNGTYAKTGTLMPDITFIVPGDRTYNENLGVYIFPSALLQYRLFSINTLNGAVITNPLINNKIMRFQYSTTTNTLYGLEQDNLNNEKRLISINQTTGTYAQVGNSVPSSAIFQGFVTLNEIGGEYIFLDPGNILYSLNITNGSIISNPNLLLGIGEDIRHFQFDNSTGILYGLLRDTGINKYFLVTINQLTGVITKIGLGTTFGNGNGSATINEVAQEYIYIYSDNLGQEQIITLDLATGNVLASASMQGNNFDNFLNLEYDNTKGKLYSLHYDMNITGCAMIITPTNATNTWLGCTNTDWTTSTNWSTGTVPTVADIVYIPIGAANQLIIDEIATCGKMIVQIGAKCIVDFNAGGRLVVKF